MFRPLALASLALGCALAASAETCPAPEPTRDGSRDFDFEIGAWKTHVKRLKGALTGSGTWVEYEGTSVVRGVLDGRANLVELSITGPAGRIEGAALRLYEPQAKRWTINYFSVADGQLTAPLSGTFSEGRGVFCGDDTLSGKPIQVRFVISKVDANTWRFEQAFSADRGKTWEVNWVATDTRAG
jgi:hypothetical protein